MDSRLVQSEVHENDEYNPHIVASEQLTHGVEEDHFDQEKKSVLNKVKAKAKKIKDKIKKHGHQVLDRGHEYNNEDQHALDDHDIDEDEEMTEDPQVLETPFHVIEDVKAVTQVENLGKSGINFEGTTVKEEELGGVSSTTEIDQNTAKTFYLEEKAGMLKDNLERSIGLEEVPHAPYGPEACSPHNYKTKVTDPIGIGKDEIEIAPIEESFAKMNVDNEPKPTIEKMFHATAADSEYPPAVTGNHDKFVPHLSAATQTQYHFAEIQDQFNEDTISTNININLENPTETRQSFTTATAVEEQSHNEASTDAVVSPKDVMVSESGSGEKDDIKDKVNEDQKKSGVASNMSSSTTQYEKIIAHTLTEKLAPDYEKGSEVKSEVTGTSTGGVETETKNGVKEHDKGASVKDYLAEKLRPGEEDKALSEVISEVFHNKSKEEPMKKEEGNLDSWDEKMCEEKCVNSSAKGVVHKIKGVVGSWFGKSEDKGGDDLSKNTNSGAAVHQVNQVVGEISSPVEDQ